MRRGRDATAAAQDHLVAHELAVVLRAATRTKRRPWEPHVLSAYALEYPVSC